MMAWKKYDVDHLECVCGHEYKHHYSNGRLCSRGGCDCTFFIGLHAAVLRALYKDKIQYRVKRGPAPLDFVEPDLEDIQELLGISGELLDLEVSC